MGEVEVDVQAVVDGWLEELRASGGMELDAYFGKRKEPRFHVWCEALELRVDDEIIVARGENLTSHGVGFVCKQSLSQSAELEMRRVGERAWVPIRVRHCTQTIGSFKIGARFIL